MRHDGTIKSFKVETLRAALIQPFRTALGDHNSLENVLFTLELSDGTRGFGEAAIATHITGETLPATLKNLNTAGEKIIGRDISEYPSISAGLYQKLYKNGSALAAAEMAMLDVLAKKLKVPLWRLFGKTSELLKTDITIVIADLEETELSAKKFYAQGFGAFKVKIGRDMDLDFKRVQAVNRITKGSPIYLDANQGYSAEETLKFLKSLKRAGIRISLLEQPVPKEDWEGLKKVTRVSGVPVCADESCKSIGDALRIIKEKAAGVINIKFMKTGIVYGREIANLANRMVLIS
ncbi:MAG: dipeptide epimerase [Candidatus Omnitrophica bacterium]|nr:dipeptide epimerase [Candidatus Omnitrophota bacterium]